MRIIDSPLYYLVLGGLCGWVGFRLGWRSGSRLGLPLIQGTLGWFAFAASWRARGALAGALAVAGWALGTTLASLAAFVREPQRIDAQVWRAAEYRASMRHWLDSGRGFPVGPTIVAHLRELALYVVGAALTANVAGVLMGALLLNYMNAWVVRLFIAARKPAVVRVLAWNVWSVLRVAAYIALGAAAATPIATRLGYPVRAFEVESLLVFGGAGALFDLLLKLALSGPAGRKLAGAVEPSALGRETPAAGR